MERDSGGGDQVTDQRGGVLREHRPRDGVRAEIEVQPPG